MSTPLSSSWSSISADTATAFEDNPASPANELDDGYQSRRLRLKQSLDRITTEGPGISTEIEIPRVVVIGSQSSGKSSLFEGISGVSLPRDTGTCTRCPIICQMTQVRGGRWRCRVYLVREKVTEGDSGEPARRIPFGEELFDKEQVCDQIRRAQAAILHPDIDPSDFLGPYKKMRSSGFSMDSILVEISGPKVVDLSFVDLPGVIAMDTEEPENVEKVEQMVKSYVQNVSSLILLVYKCNDDLLNQGAGRIAKMHDPMAERTITVLTKPDLIETGQEGEWQKMIRTSRSCFCVRQPAPNQLSTMTQEAAREQEEGFFQENASWREFARDLDIQQRLGTRNLANYLNARLLEWIVERLPVTIAGVQRHLKEAQAELALLPTSIRDPVRHANEILWKFGRKMSAAVDIHNFRVPELVGVCRRRLEEFVDILLYHLHPRFWPFETYEARGVPNPTDLDAFPPLLPKIKTFNFSPPRNLLPPGTVYLDEVMTRADIGRTRELPGNHPYGILKDYMEKSVDVWTEPTESMLKDIVHQIVSELKTIVQEHFGSFKPGGRIWEEVKSHIESRGDLARDALLKSIQREKASSLVFGRSEYFHYRQVYLDHYMSLRTGVRICGGVPDALRGLGYSAARISEAMGDPVAGVACRAGTEALSTGIEALSDGESLPDAISEGIEAGAKVATGGMKGGITRRSPPLSGDEEHGIAIMAQTRAFYHIAVRRYAEGAAQIVFHDLLLDLQCGPDLEQKLRGVIGLSDPDFEDKCRKFVEPSNDTMRRRDELERKVAVFTEVLTELNSFY